jgi:hypothetical protein
MVKIKKQAPPKSHGGKRPGAGRPVVNTVPLCVRVKSETAEKLKSLAGKLGKTPGQWLDTCLAPAGSGIIAHQLAILQSEIRDRRQFCLKAAKEFRKQDPKRAAEFESNADGLKEALRMVEEKLEIG